VEDSVAVAGTEASQLLSLLQRLVAQSVKGCRFWVVPSCGTAQAVGWGLKPRPVALPLWHGRTRFDARSFTENLSPTLWTTVVAKLRRSASLLNGPRCMGPGLTAQLEEV